MRPDRVSACDCIVLEKIGGLVQIPVTLWAVLLRVR